jgi:hypothetical protein
VLLSVFVNPLQFGPQEDFARYPRDLEGDTALAAQAGADALFAPAVEDLYPGGEELLTHVQAPPALAGPLCGRSRPGHFDGVATVVCRLLALVRPQRLLLGEKDWQQLLVLRRVIHDLGLPVTVEGCPGPSPPPRLCTAPAKGMGPPWSPPCSSTWRPPAWPWSMENWSISSGSPPCARLGTAPCWRWRSAVVPHA